jgi:hypothetical protein
MKIGTLKTCVHVTNVKMEHSTREKPFRFNDLTDAIAFSRISGRILYCVIGPEVDFFRVYPGGRVEDWTLVAKRCEETMRPPVPVKK